MIAKQAVCTDITCQLVSKASTWGTVAALGLSPYYWAPCTDMDFNHSVD